MQDVHQERHMTITARTQHNITADC